jgi:GT2 family glycosyltransferase
VAQRQAAFPGCAVAGRVENGLPSDPRAEASQLLVDYLCEYHNGPGPFARFATSNNLTFPAQGFRSVGGFDPDFARAGAEDRDLCERWTGSGHRLVFADDAVVDHFHAMTLAGFVRQHLRYGRGAHRFHRKRARSGAPRLEPLRFYLDLLGYPARRGRGSLRLFLLMLLSQVANATGFAQAALTGASPAAAPAPEPLP